MTDAAVAIDVMVIADHRGVAIVVMATEAADVTIEGEDNHGTSNN